MLKRLLVCAVIFVAISIGVVSFAMMGACAADAGSEHPKADKAVNVGNTICPVSGEAIGKEMEPATYEYEGKIYNFCCTDCIAPFKKDPNKYIAKISQETGHEAHEGHPR